MNYSSLATPMYTATEIKQVGVCVCVFTHEYMQDSDDILPKVIS